MKTYHGTLKLLQEPTRRLMRLHWRTPANRVQQRFSLCGKRFEFPPPPETRPEQMILLVELIAAFQRIPQR